MTEAKPSVEPTPIDLGDGKERGLLYDAPAVVALEETAKGRSIFRLILTESGIAHISLMVWGGLLWKEPDLSLRDVQGAIFDRFCNGAEVNQFIKPIFEALMRSGLLGRRKADTPDDAKAGGKELDPTKGVETKEPSPDGGTPNSPESSATTENSPGKSSA